MGAYALGEIVMKLEERKRIMAETMKKEKLSFSFRIPPPFL